MQGIKYPAATWRIQFPLRHDDEEDDGGDGNGGDGNGGDAGEV